MKHENTWSVMTRIRVRQEKTSKHLIEQENTWSVMTSIQVRQETTSQHLTGAVERKLMRCWVREKKTQV